MLIRRFFLKSFFFQRKELFSRFHERFWFYWTKFCLYSLNSSLCFSKNYRKMIIKFLSSMIMWNYYQDNRSSISMREIIYWQIFSNSRLRRSRTNFFWRVINNMSYEIWIQRMNSRIDKWLRYEMSTQRFANENRENRYKKIEIQIKKFESIDTKWWM
jgi:hypothetical protein